MTCLLHRAAPTDAADPAEAPRRRGRCRRVAALLGLLWLLNGMDLAWTVSAARAGQFVEVNPLAAPLLGQAVRLAAFKVGLVAFASAVLLACRRQRVAEVGCWGVAGAYLVLTGLWAAYFAIAP